MHTCFSCAVSLNYDSARHIFSPTSPRLPSPTPLGRPCTSLIKTPETAGTKLFDPPSFPPMYHQSTDQQHKTAGLSRWDSSSGRTSGATAETSSATRGRRRGLRTTCCTSKSRRQTGGEGPTAATTGSLVAVTTGGERRGRSGYCCAAASGYIPCSTFGFVCFWSCVVRWGKLN